MEPHSHNRMVGNGGFYAKALVAGKSDSVCFSNLEVGADVISASPTWGRARGRLGGSMLVINIFETK